LRRAASVARAVLRNWVRSKEGVFFSLLFPVMLLLIFGSLFGSSGGGGYSIYVQNLDVSAYGIPSPTSAAYINTLNSSKVLQITEMIPQNVTDVVAYVKAKQGFFADIPRVLVVPEGFAAELSNASSGGVARPLGLDQAQTVVTNSLIFVYDPSSSSSQTVKGIVYGLTQTFEYSFIGVAPSLTLEDQPYTARSFKAVEYYLPGYIGAFVMTNGIMVVSASTAEFKKRGILKRLATTPLSRTEWVLGNVAAQAVLGLLLTAVMLLTGYAVFGITVVPDVLSITLVLAGAVAFSGIGMILAGALKDAEAVNAASNAISFPMMFLSGAFFPLEAMPGYLQTISHFLPLTYLSSGLRSSLITADAAGALVNLAIVLAVGACAVVAGAKLTRWHDM
jgi:ABC-2 type transport system permease protein